MDILEGIRSRKSIRAFDSKPVFKQVLLDILEVAIRAPSGVNRQPWEFFIARGEVLKEFKLKNLEKHRLGEVPHPEIPIGPIKGISPALDGIFREREVGLAKQMFKLLEIPKGEKEKQRKWTENMVQCYDAPAVIFVVVDKQLLGNWPILDTGFVCQNILLAAQEKGLGTCVMRAAVDYPQQVREIVGIPETKRIIVGIAIGYPDWNHPVNQLNTSRENIEKIVTLAG